MMQIHSFHLAIRVHHPVRQVILLNNIIGHFVNNVKYFQLSNSEDNGLSNADVEVRCFTSDNYRFKYRLSSRADLRVLLKDLVIDHDFSPNSEM